MHPLYRNTPPSPHDTTPEARVVALVDVSPADDEHCCVTPFVALVGGERRVFGLSNQPDYVMTDNEWRRTHANIHPVDPPVVVRLISLDARCSALWVGRDWLARTHACQIPFAPLITPPWYIRCDLGSATICDTALAVRSQRDWLGRALQRFVNAFDAGDLIVAEAIARLMLQALPDDDRTDAALWAIAESRDAGDAMLQRQVLYRAELGQDVSADELRDRHRRTLDLS